MPNRTSYICKSYIFIAMAMTMMLLSACKRDVSWVDFGGNSSSPFRVYGYGERSIADAASADCYLPDGTPLVQYRADSSGVQADEVGMNNGPHRVSSTTSTNIAQQLLGLSQSSKVVELSGTYRSVDAHGDSITLSGKVLLPKGKEIKRLILISHYTIGSNVEAPSNSFPLEGILVKDGYGLIVPDYIGYGVTADKIHPYLMMDLTARNVLDMYRAVLPYLKEKDVPIANEDIYLMGYSQGGATTMAVERLIETEYPDVKIRRVFAGGGPYDVKTTYERFVTTNIAGYPVAVPLVVQGMVKGMGLRDSLMNDLMQPTIVNHLDEWINSKRYSTSQINAMIDSHVTSDLLTKDGMDQTSPAVAELYKAMATNSIVRYNWTPKAPVYMMHSIDDETVPYENAAQAHAKWASANIQVNFGHYGGHVATALQFILSVQNLLREEEREIQSYE